MRTVLLSAVLLFVLSSKLSATESIIFDGGGYTIDVLVGEAEGPAVAQVRFTAPGSEKWVIVPRESLKIEKFDDDKRLLVMRFSNNGEPDLPASFSLSVKKDKGVLSINGKQVRGSFNWAE